MSMLKRSTVGPPPGRPVDPVAQAVIAEIAAAGGGGSMAGVTPAQVRAGPDFVVLRDFAETPLPSVRALRAPLPGRDVDIRLYEPSLEPGPLAVYIHGGCWVFCDLDSHDHVCRRLAAESGVKVASIGYRLAPEHPFPAGLDDCRAAARWLLEHAETFGLMRDRIAFVGDSAGGNLSIASALAERDSPDPLPVRFLGLIYPIADAASLDTESYRAFGEGLILTREVMAWAIAHYAPDVARRTDPLISPVRADLRGLPPTLVLTAEYDPLRDEGEALAERLAAAGSPTELIRFHSAPHAFVAMGGRMDLGRQALDLVAHRLRDALGPAR